MAGNVLDNSFGNQGTVLGFANGSATSLQVQDDGKIVSAGYVVGATTTTTTTSGKKPTTTTTTDPRDLALMRHLSDGSPDTTFGTLDPNRSAAEPNKRLGKVQIDFGSGLAELFGEMAIDNAGRFVVVGTEQSIPHTTTTVVRGKTTTTTYYTSAVVVARFTPTGDLDATFGSAGKLLFQFTDANATSLSAGKSVVIHPDPVSGEDKIIIGAEYSYSPETKGRAFALARLNDDGTFDASFGTNGKTFTSVGLVNSTMGRIDVQNVNGRAYIVAPGQVTDVSDGSNRPDGVLARFNLDVAPGSLDTSFGTGGAVRLDGGTNTNCGIFNIAFQTDGQIIAMNQLQITSPERTESFTSLARFTANGILDNTFRPDAQVSPAIGGNDIGNQYMGHGLILQGTSILITGALYSSYGDPQRTFVARFTSEGTLDPNFATNGFVVLNLENLVGIALQTDGKILVSGRTSAPSTWAVARITADTPAPLVAPVTSSTDLALLAFTDDSDSIDDEDDLLDFFSLSP